MNGDNRMIRTDEGFCSRHNPQLRDTCDDDEYLAALKVRHLEFLGARITGKLQYFEIL